MKPTAPSPFSTTANRFMRFCRVALGSRVGPAALGPRRPTRLVDSSRLVGRRSFHSLAPPYNALAAICLFLFAASALSAEAPIAIEPPARTTQVNFESEILPIL